MARGLARGDIWLCQLAPPDKRRPVLVLSRDAAIRHLHAVIVAPITSTIRGLPTEVVLDESHGMKGRCAINFDSVQLLRKEALVRYVASLDEEVMSQACQALAIATGCS